MSGVIGGNPTLRGVVGRRGGQASVSQHPGQFPRGLLATVDQLHVVAHHPPEQWLQHRIVGAAEDEFVDPGGAERRKVLLRHEAGRLMLEPPLLHQRHEERTGTIHHLEIRADLPPDAIVPAVPMTPTLLRVVALAAARAPGSMTPMTGSGARARRSSSACAVAVLQAITTALTPWPTSQSRISREYRRTVSGDFGPYGTRAVSPK